jgi:DNA invertase Pin-like site-specific DNA recombinase
VIYTERKITKRPAFAPEAPARLRVAAYARVSCGKEAMLHSLSAQVSHYSGYIQRHSGWAYAGVYADEAATGTKDGRAEFQRLLADCRAGKIDMILTKSISRFARNTVHLIQTTRELKELGIDVRFEDERIHSMSVDGELMLTILASYAQAESLSVSENCKWRIRDKFANGELAGLRFLYGFDVEKGNISINGEQAAVVRQIFADYLAGFGGAKIAQRLNAAGVPAYGGGQWDARRILDLVRNEKLAGEAVLQKTFVADHLTKKQIRNRGQLPKYHVEGALPAIVSPAAFAAAQEIRAERAGKFKARDVSANRYPFSEKITCGLCGKHYRRRQKKRGPRKDFSLWGKGAAREQTTFPHGLCAETEGADFVATWQCAAFLEKGKAACGAKQIPEEILYALTAGLGGVENITEIRALPENRLCFVLKDGTEAARTWQDRSRRESWTPEMREKAREAAYRRNQK